MHDRLKDALWDALGAFLREIAVWCAGVVSAWLSADPEDTDEQPEE